MQKLILKIFTLICIIVLTSCSNFGGKASYISSFNRFVNIVSEKQETYTEEDWEKADARFEQFVDTDYEKYSRQLTKEEKHTIGKLKGKYLAIRAKSKIGGFMDNLQNTLDKFGGVVDGFIEELNVK